MEDADIIAAIEYACDNGADVVNGSFGSPSFSVAIANAVSDLSCANTLFVFAAGNDGWDLDTNSGDEDESYPQRAPPGPHERVERPLRGGHRPCGHDRRFSNSGTSAVHLAAPGVNIRSTWPAYSSLPASRRSRGLELVLQQPPATARRPAELEPDDSAEEGWLLQPRRLATNYPNDANRTIRRLAPLNLAGRAGCFVERRLDAESQFDFFDVLAGTTTGATTLIGS